MKKIRKTAAFLMALLIIAPMGLSVYSDTEDEQSQEQVVEESSEEEEEEEEKPRTKEEAFAAMELVCENKNLGLYLNSDEDTIALLDKKTGEIWFSNPVDLETSNAKKSQKQELASGMTLTYAEPANRATTAQTSKGKGSTKTKKTKNGVDFTYKYNQPGITVKVHVTLEEDYLKLYVNTADDIEEEHPSTADGQLTSDLAFFTTFGAAGLEDEGYFVVPDGSGAVVNFNNGKTGLRTYTGKVYGRDITQIKQQATAVTQNVSLPMYGIVRGNSALMVVADKGDTSASINTYVSNQNNTDYNSAYFDFEVRTSDEYLMGGESNPLKVFEKRGILVPEIEVRYYPVSNENGDEMNYVDIANKYRDYLTKDKGVVDSDIPATSPLYVDFYGGTLEKKSVLGIPVTVKQAVTSFDDAKGILEELKGSGVGDMVVTFNKYSNEDIGEKITDSFSPAGKLGGKSGWNKLESYASSNGISLFPSVDNTQYKTGNGYWTMTNTAIRVSNAFARLPVYDLAHGVENKYYSPLSLFSPASYEKAYSKLIKSYSKKGETNFAFGSLANTIYGDYGKQATSRELAKGIIAGIYENAASNGNVLAADPSAYVLPYADQITDVPIDSSNFDLFDYEIPFFQIVMHGVTPYSSIAVNSEANPEKAILTSLASGSNLSFDFIAAETEELKDTKLDKYYYAYYKNWMSEAKGLAELADKVLAPVANEFITAYNIEDDGRRIETVYSNGYKTVVDYDKLTITADGKEYKISDYFVGEADE